MSLKKNKHEINFCRIPNSNKLRDIRADRWQPNECNLKSGFVFVIDIAGILVLDIIIGFLLIVLQVSSQFLANIFLVEKTHMF